MRLKSSIPEVIYTTRESGAGGKFKDSPVRCDVAIGDFSVTAYRDSCKTSCPHPVDGEAFANKHTCCVDFSHTFMDAGIALVSKVRASGSGFSGTLARFWSPRIVNSIAAGFLAVLVVGAIIWAVERKYQPRNFKYMDEGIWLALVTLSTVGYGDRVPVSSLGRIITALWMIVSVMIASTLTANLTAVLVESNEPQIAKTGLDIKSRKLSVCAGPGYFEDWAAREAITMTKFPTSDECLQAVVNDEYDVYLTDNVIAWSIFSTGLYEGLVVSPVVWPGDFAPIFPQDGSSVIRGGIETNSLAYLEGLAQSNPTYADSLNLAFQGIDTGDGLVFSDGSGAAAESNGEGYEPWLVWTAVAAIGAWVLVLMWSGIQRQKQSDARRKAREAHQKSRMAQMKALQRSIATRARGLDTGKPAISGEKGTITQRIVDKVLPGRSDSANRIGQRKPFWSKQSLGRNDGTSSDRRTEQKGTPALYVEDQASGPEEGRIPSGPNAQAYPSLTFFSNAGGSLTRAAQGAGATFQGPAEETDDQALPSSSEDPQQSLHVAPREPGLSMRRSGGAIGGTPGLGMATGDIVQSVAHLQKSLDALSRTVHAMGSRLEVNGEILQTSIPVLIGAVAELLGVAPDGTSWTDGPDEPEGLGRRVSVEAGDSFFHHRGGRRASDVGARLQEVQRRISTQAPRPQFPQPPDSNHPGRIPSHFASAAVRENSANMTAAGGMTRAENKTSGENRARGGTRLRKNSVQPNSANPNLV